MLAVGSNPVTALYLGASQIAMAAIGGVQVFTTGGGITP